MPVPVHEAVRVAGFELYIAEFQIIDITCHFSFYLGAHTELVECRCEIFERAQADCTAADVAFHPYLADEFRPGVGVLVEQFYGRDVDVGPSVDEAEVVHYGLSSAYPCVSGKQEALVPAFFGE